MRDPPSSDQELCEVRPNVVGSEAAVSAAGP